MSLYELLSMQNARRRIAKRVVRISDEEWDESRNLLAELAARDPSVRI